MAKPRKKRRRVAPAPRAPVTTAAVPTPESTKAPIARSGKIRQIGSRLLDSAISAALDNFWPIVGGFVWSGLVTAAVTVGLYFTAGKASWLYPVLKYGVAFSAGSLWVLLVLLVLALWGVRRRKRKEKLSSSKYVSKEKGYLDYRAEFEPTTKEFQSVLRDIGNELFQVGERAGITGKRISVWAFSPRLTRRSASRGAAFLNKHAEKMEKLARRLEEKAAAYLEVSTGSIKHAPSASQGNLAPLLAVQDAVVDIDGHLSSTISTMGNFRVSVRAVYGQSQDLNTSVNWLVAVSDEIIRILTDIRSSLAADTVPLLTQKLSS